jgi:hypothetical protein
MSVSAHRSATILAVALTSLLCQNKIPPIYSVIGDPSLHGLLKMPRDLFEKVREQPPHNGLMAVWDSGFVKSMALVLGFGPRLRMD